MPARAARRTRRARAPARARRAAGALGLLGVLASAALIGAGAATRPGQYVPARSGGWPGWLAGPLQGLDVGLGGHTFQTLMLVMCASYLLVLATARSLSTRALAGTVALAHTALMLGPPLISQDVFGYVAFARMGALHGLDPYTHIPAEAPTDAVFKFVGWPFLHSPYGPLFTLASYATAPLGLAGALWTFKAVAVLASLAAVALIARTCARIGLSARWATAFVGLNPVLLVLAVGGAHNDTLLLLALAAALALATAPSPRLRAAAAALALGVGVKVTAGLALPFLVLAPARWRERRRVAAAAALSLLAVALVGVVGFGIHTLGFLGAVGEQQQLVATHSLPAETARLVGLSGTPSWWRHLFVAGFVAVLCCALWRTGAARRDGTAGANWIVAAGWTTLALLLSTAWLLPWYAIWLLPLAAVSGDRRLRAVTLLFCAYAVLIHLSLADPLLSPGPTHGSPRSLVRIPGLGHRLELTGFQTLGHVKLDLRW
jgi:Glycosyltransferase family 87